MPTRRRPIPSNDPAWDAHPGCAAHAFVQQRPFISPTATFVQRWDERGPYTGHVCVTDSRIRQPDPASPMRRPIRPGGNRGGARRACMSPDLLRGEDEPPTGKSPWRRAPGCSRRSHTRRKRRRGQGGRRAPRRSPGLRFIARVVRARDSRRMGTVSNVSGIRVAHRARTPRHAAPQAARPRRWETRVRYRNPDTQAMAGISH